jgi:hypothetical protein
VKELLSERKGVGNKILVNRFLSPLLYIKCETKHHKKKKEAPAVKDFY